MPDNIRRCPCCGNAMKLVSLVPALYGLPETCTFRCFVCNEVLAEAVDETKMGATLEHVVRPGLLRRPYH
jgi:hypothetical protein